MTSIVINDSLISNQDPWEKLDDATVESILALLPVAVYFRSQFVSRRWGSVIRSPTFPKASKKLFNRLPWVLIMNILRPSNLVYDMEVDDWRWVDLSISLDNQKLATPVAASNGLLCCISDPGDLFVCNPLTRRTREVVILADTVHCKAITMHVISPSSYLVCVVQLQQGRLFMRIFSPVVNRRIEFHLKLYKLVQNSGDANNRIELPRYPGELEPPLCGTVFDQMPTTACVRTVNTTGELVVYFFESNGQLVGCYCDQKIAIMFPPILSSDFSFDLVECHGRILVPTLASEDETEMLRVWEFDHEDKQWKNVATMPPEMSEGYNGINPLIDCTAYGDFIMICVSSIEYNVNKVTVFNLVENTWKELPICVDPRCGQPRRFSSVISFMPSIEDMP